MVHKQAQQGQIVRRSADKLATQLDDAISQELVGFFELSLAGDPFLAMSQEQGKLGKSGRLTVGRVQFAIPGLNWYRVATSDRGVICCYGGESQTSPEPIGPRGVGMYSPQTEVLVYQGDYPRENYGLILCAVPQLVTNGNLNISDFVVQGSATGFKREGYYRSYLLDLGDEGGAADYSNHRPLDQTSLDWGVTTETGLSLHLDPFLAYLRVDEVCGLFLHYSDQLAVLAGYNFDLVTAAATEMHRDDEGELSVYRGEAMYPWEMLGLLSPGEAASRANSDLDVHFDKPEGKIEPAVADQSPFCRYEEWGGYLGQVRVRFVGIPPAGGSADYLWRQGDNRHPIGVFREQISPDGEYALASAKGVTISKRTLLAHPKRRRDSGDYHEQADFSDNENYRFSGQGSQGALHLPGGDLEPQGDHSDRLAAAAILDHQAQLFNWKNLHVFHYHTGDFLLPEENEAGIGSTLQEIPDFNELSDKMWLSGPEPVTLPVDPRQEAKYYALLSMLSLQDDGSVVLQGGFGEEIKFDHGNILISCPGNVLLQPGKSVVAMAGDDVVIRANHSVDITTSQNDIRFAAFRNLHMLSGNSGEGGILLETRSSGTEQFYPEEGGEQIRSSGIVFKAPYSQVATLSREIYLATGVTGPDGVNRGGPITIDAAKGRQDIQIRASSLFNFLSGQRIDAFLSGSEVTSAHYTGPNGLLVQGQLGVAGPLRCHGYGIFAGNVQTSNGHFGSPQGGLVGRVVDQALLQAETQEVGTFLADRSQAANQQYQTEVRERYYSFEQIGNSDAQIAISFGLRNETQYGTENFSLPASHWQNLAEAAGQGYSWLESAVIYQRSQPQMPWPGIKNWRDQETLLTLPPSSFNQYDIERGHAKSRAAGSYETPKRGPFVAKSPQLAYKVIVP